MFKTALLLSLLFAPMSKASEIGHSVGVGLQHAGIVGYQLSLKQDIHRFRAAAGVIGLSGGYDYFITAEWALGLTYMETFRTTYAVNINYFPNPSGKGFNMGLDFAHMLDNKSDGFFKTDGTKNVLWFNVGYTF